MPKASVHMKLSDLRGEPVHGQVYVDLVPQTGEAGTGGDHFELRVPSMGAATQLIMTGVTCRGGVGTLYRVRVSTDAYRTYAFFLNVKPGEVRPAPVRLWVDAGAVTGIEAPAFARLDGRLRSILSSAAMVANSTQDEDLLGLGGAALYDALGPLRKACLLNIFRKATHLASTGNSFQFIHSLVLSRQDRCFVKIDGAVLQFLQDSPAFAEAPGTLHTPLPNYHLRRSYKSKDAHANLQVTVMENPVTGEFAADVDIDEAAGIQHGLEVMRNAIFDQRTNPYLIREFMLAADTAEGTLDPGYDFEF